MTPDEAVTLQRLEQMQRLAKLSESQLQQEIFPVFLKQVRHAFGNTKYWNRTLAPYAQKIAAARSVPKLLEAIPVLPRRDVQTYAPQLRTIPKGVRKDQISQTSTSGSTGQPVITLSFSQEVRPWRNAISLLDAIWQERDFTRPFCTFNSKQGDMIGRLPAKPYNLIGNAQPAHNFRTLDRSFSEILDYIHEHEIGIVLMNMVQARGVAREQILNPRPNLKLSDVMAWTETVRDEDRQLVRDAFGAKVSNRYSSEEFAYLAIQCPKYEHLHALQFFNYIEIVDDDGKPCPPGVTGQVVVSSLHNRIQPMFRYQLGDAAAWGEPCDSGVNLPVFLPQLTRQRDLIKLPNGLDWQPAIARTALVKEPIVYDFQIVLFENVVVVLLTPTRNWNEEAAQRVRDSVAAEFPIDIPVVIIETTDMRWLGTWKRRTFIKLAERADTTISETELRDRVLASGYKPDGGLVATTTIEEGLAL